MLNTSRTSAFAFTLLPAALLLGLASCATSGDPDDGFDDSEQDIIGGARSGDRSVVALRTYGSKAGQDCTAVLVAPDAVVTAAHCVHSYYIGTFRSTAISGRETPGSTGWIQGYTPIIHPLFDPNNLGAGHDIAVILLRSNYTLAPPAVLTKWTLPATWGSAARRAANPTTLRIVGYGAAINSTTAPHGTRLERMVPLTGLHAEHVVAGNGTAGQQCYGDSGGPTFLGYWGAWNVVGIASFAAGDCTTGSWSARIDTNYGFLRQALGTRIPATLLPPPSTFPGL